AIAERWGVMPYPFYLGVAIAVSGLIISAIWVKDTKWHITQEASGSTMRKLNNIFKETTFKDKVLSTITQAGFINNFNDGMIWGLLPVALYQAHFRQEKAGIIAATYPLVWGVGQLFTGRLSDRANKRIILSWGMLLQALAILFMVVANDFISLLLLSALLGVGTAMVYPTFLAAIAAYSFPLQRAESLGVFRFWRDMGYAVGALCSGLLADWFGLYAAFCFTGLLTATSALLIWRRLPAHTTENKS
ncbi:MAG: MFS transporter, partial [Chitinophagales bacterium]|nr:MFS transporter [Chitinophagales bacterium]